MPFSTKTRDNLTPDQRARRMQQHRLHYIRQSQMPPESRPRLSPRSNIPGRIQGIDPSRLQSCRTCVEKPDTNPNDFRYLFRTTGGTPVFVWLDMDGANPDHRVHDTIYAAVISMYTRGWEDASW